MRKKGFTLIELLAVIIVLAIIALIATPIIFNVIENAKLKSLENSCYGIIDTVRTNYAENLLNSTDGQVKLKGSVTELTVAGEKPIAGTWEIDNTVDSNDRGIKIKDVKFASMKDYTCTNVNSDGTINSKVMCTKNEVKETDLACFEYTDILDYEINLDGCISYINEINDSGIDIENEEAIKICNNEEPFMFGYIKEVSDMQMANNKSLTKQLTDQGVITPKITNKEFNINIDKCITFISENMFGGETLTDTQLASIKGMCEGNVPIEGDTYIKDMLVDGLISGDVDVNFVKETGIVDEIPTRRIVTGYTCDSKDVVIPSSITTIGSLNEKQLTNLDFSKAENLEIILTGAFKDNKLTSVIIPDSVKIIGIQAFMNNQIVNLKLSNNIKVISVDAFANNKLTSIKIPNSVTTIDNNAFYNNKLESVTLPNNIEIIECGTFKDNELINVTIPSSVKIIDNEAFMNNKLTSVEIPNSVKEINSEAFANNQLLNVDLSNATNLTKLSGFNNNQLTSVVIPNSVITIDDGAFMSNKLTTIKIPNSVTTIDGGAFNGNQLTNVDLSNATNLTKLSGFCGNQLTNIVIPNNITTIGNAAFCNNQLTSVIIPNGVTTIGSSAFSGNQLINVEISNSVKEIGNEAFMYNGSLKQITIDNTKDAITGSPWGAYNVTITWKRS